MTAISRRTLLAAGMGAATALAAPPARAQARRTITVASQRLPPTMEPMDTPGTSSVWYRTQYNVFEGLLGLDFHNNLAVRGVLAERWERKDGRTWEFALRRGVKFHDGTELTAEDVLVSLGPERLTGAGAPGRASAKTFLPTFERAEKIDDRTVRLIANTDDAVFDRRIAAWGGQIISAAAFRAAPNWQSWAMHPVGTGPYKVEGIRGDYGISLVAHDAYWGGTPPLAGICFREVPEVASRVAGLLAGDWDIATDISPDVIAEIESRAGFKVRGVGSNVTRMVVLDARHNPQLKDVRLRRALSLAVDHAGRRIIGLNAQLFGTGLVREEQQWSWLAEAVGDAGQRPLAIVLHKPLATPDRAESDNPNHVGAAAYERLRSIMVDARLKLVISGHYHHYRINVGNSGTHLWLPSTALIGRRSHGLEPFAQRGPGFVALALDGEEASFALVPTPAAYAVDPVALAAVHGEAPRHWPELERVAAP